LLTKFFVEKRRQYPVTVPIKETVQKNYWIGFQYNRKEELHRVAWLVRLGIWLIADTDNDLTITSVA